MERTFTITTGKLIEVEITIEAGSEEEALASVDTEIPCDHEEVGDGHQYGDIMIEEKTTCCECCEPASHCLTEDGDVTLFLCEDCAKEYKGFDELTELE